MEMGNFAVCLTMSCNYALFQLLFNISTTVKNVDYNYGFPIYLRQIKSKIIIFRNHAAYCPQQFQLAARSAMPSSISALN